MTNALLSQEAAVVADKGGTNGNVAQVAVVAAVLEVVFAAQAKVSQEAPVAAIKTDSSLIASLSQLSPVAAQSGSANIIKASQMAIIAVTVEPPFRVPLFPFTIGNFPTQPMYRR